MRTEKFTGFGSNEMTGKDPFSGAGKGKMNKNEMG